MQEKVCTKCKETKCLNDFHCSKRNLDGRMAECKVCKNKYRKEYYELNASRESEYNIKRAEKAKAYGRWFRSLTLEQKLALKTDRVKMIDEFSAIKKANFIESKKVAKEQKIIRDTERKLAVEANKIKRAELSIQLKAAAKIKANQQFKEAYHNDPLFKIKELTRQRMIKVFKRNNWSRDRRSLELLGAPYSTVREHIENLFKPGMTWDNHGAWHIDHAVPLDSAKSPEEVLPLFHYKNLQPLWAAENISKGSKFFL